MSGWVGGVQTKDFRISRLFGPCTAMLQSCSDDDFTHALRPRFSACSRSQTPE